MTSYVLYRIAMTIAIMVFVVLASIYYHFFPLTAIMLIALALLDDVPIMPSLSTTRPCHRSR